MIAKSKVKYIQSLSDKKQRDADGVFIAEGPRVVQELLGEARFPVMELFALDHWSPGVPLPDGLVVQRVAQRDLQRLSGWTTAHDVLGVFRRPAVPEIRLEGKLTLMADGIQDPGNLGTLIRCADWFGISQLVCSPDCADAYGPKVVQASMGSIARVATATAELDGVLQRYPDIPVYAATLVGRPLPELVFPDEAVLLIGSESRGIRPELLKRAQVCVTIPRRGGGESLNAAVAAGILLFHATQGHPAP